MAPLSSDLPLLPWYGEGLRFECQPDCGACCTDHGEYAYVYLDEGEAERIADLLGLVLADFLERYTTLDDGHTILRMDEPDCPFLEAARCAVYDARPVQCRTFPFWDENLKTRAAWRKLAKFCPGIDRGPEVPRTEAQTMADLAAGRHR